MQPSFVGSNVLSPSHHHTRKPDIIVSDRDHSILAGLLDGFRRGQRPLAARFLQSELERAQVLPLTAMPANVVTLGAHVLFRDHGTQRARDIKLLSPSESQYDDDGISVLTFLGGALLGLSEGQTLSYRAPGGRIRTISVQQVLLQPRPYKTLI